MANITIQDVKASLGVEQSYDIVNAITNSSPATFGQYVPLASWDNVVDVGKGIMINQTTQNEFVVNLVNRIGLVVVRKKHLQNPLAKFKKGAMTQGTTIEEIFTDIAKAQKYDPYDAEETVFQRTFPNVKVLFHERNRQDMYPYTISQEQLKAAFVSWGAFDNFISSIINSIYNSAEVDEYEYMKLLIDNAYSEGLFTVVKVTEPTDATSTSLFVKQLRSTARKMTLPQGSRDWNALAVRTRTEMSDLHLFIDADLEAEMDVDVLAKAFNMDRTNFLGNVTVIDGFASSGLQAVLVDKSWFMVYDNLLQLETIRNPKGLFWNGFYHVWQILSISRFANAVAFVSGTVEPITNVIVDPTIASVKAGKTLQFNAYVRVTDGETYTPVWTVEASTSSTTLKGGSTISSDGLLTVDATQTGEILVKATCTYTDPSDGTTQVNVVGQSIVTIV